MKFSTKLSKALLILALTAGMTACATDTTSSSATDSTSGSTTSSSSSSGTDSTSGSTSSSSHGSSHSSGSSSSSGASSTATISISSATETSVVVKINNDSYTYQADHVINGTSVTYSDQTFTTTGTDTNAFLVINGGSLTLNNCTINKAGAGTDYENDDYNFYGLNSAVVVIGDSSATLTGTTIATTSEFANAVFSFGTSSEINCTNLTVTTTTNSSRGLYSTYGGYIKASSVNIETQGAHCAPLATDRGGGTVIVEGTGNILKAHGDGSPCIYSTGYITAAGVTGYSEESQAIVIEGKNQVIASDSTFTSDSESKDGVMLYQSMSGDASDDVASSSVSTLTLDNVTINYNGSTDYGLFYITNTTSVVNLTDCTFNANNEETMIYAGSGRWGTSGSNGGTVTFNLYSQDLTKLVNAATSDSSIGLLLYTDSVFSGTTSGSVTTTLK